MNTTKVDDTSHFDWLNHRINERSIFGRIVMQSKNEGILLDKSGNHIGNLLYSDSMKHIDEYGYRLFDLQGKLVTHVYTKRKIEYLLFKNVKKVRHLAMVSMVEESKKRKKEKGIGR